jgi:hypothetical protein
MAQERGVTVHLHMRGEDSTVNYANAKAARVEADGSLTLLGAGTNPFSRDLEPIGSIASGLWIRWIYSG